MASGSDEKKYDIEGTHPIMASGSDEKKYDSKELEREQPVKPWVEHLVLQKQQLLERKIQIFERGIKFVKQLSSGTWTFGKEDMMKKIQKAKSDGLTVKLSYNSIAFTGSAAAGKTSFLNLLHKKKIKNFHDSTNIAESTQVFSVNLTGVVGSGEQSRWIGLSHEVMLKQLKQHLENYIKTGYPSLTDSKGKCLVEDDIASAFILPNQIPGFFKYLENSNLFVPPLGEVWNVINFIDSGGQPEFINLFPAISSSIVVTFVILNMCGGVKNLDKPVLVVHSKDGKQSFEPYHLHYTNLDLVKLLMAFAKDSGIKAQPALKPINQKDANHSYQCYVGTHADKVGEKEIQEIENKLKCTADELKCTDCLWELDGNVLFPVDNTTAGSENEDPIAQKIRSQIQRLVENNSIYEVPITWFILLLEMQKHCRESATDFISYDQVVFISESGNLMKAVEDVRSALLFFHHMGVLLYYHEVPGMCQCIIINHQWLFEKLTSLITISFAREGFDVKAIDEFKSEGLLRKSLIQQIILETDIKVECFVALLVHLKVVAQVDEHNYFMPCVLSAFPSSTPVFLVQYGNLQSTELVVHFKESPIPRGFFCCLAVQIFQNLPKNWQLPLQSTKKIQHTYNNLITFHTSDTGHAISLNDKVGHLVIQVRHEKDPPSINYDVLRVLNAAIDKVCDYLQLDSDQVRFGFYCSCSEDENHIASLLEPDLRYMRCCYKQIELKPAHLIWFNPHALKKAELYDDASNTEVGVVSKPKHRTDAHVYLQQICKRFYPELTATLFTNDLSAHFVAEDIISLDDEEEIDKTSTHKQKARLVLRIIFSHLESGDTASFKKMLDIMEYNGTKPVADLAIKIKTEIESNPKSL